MKMFSSKISLIPKTPFSHFYQHEAKEKTVKIPIETLIKITIQLAMNDRLTWRSRD